MQPSDFDFWGFALGLGVFRRNKVPLELKVLGMVNYISMSKLPQEPPGCPPLFKKSAKAPCTTG
ncbi:MAG: hypothetical protein QXO71_01350 [Candidatus Jordarchaeaceae archaeon]